MEKNHSNGVGVLLAPETFQGIGPTQLEDWLPTSKVPKKKRGYFSIGIYQTKTEQNVGTLWRTAHNFGAAYIYTIGKRYTRDTCDTTFAERSIPLFHFDDIESFLRATPLGPIIGIEQEPLSRDITKFTHPEQATYLLGAEDKGLPPEILKICQHTVHIPTPMCLNVAVAGSIVLYDRYYKGK